MRRVCASRTSVHAAGRCIKGTAGLNDRRPGIRRAMAAPTAAASGTEELAARLAEIVGPDHVRTDAGIRAVFSTDATPPHRGAPDVIVWPADAAEVAAILRLATEQRVPVVPRGAGTNLSAGVIPRPGFCERPAADRASGLLPPAPRNGRLRSRAR